MSLYKGNKKIAGLVRGEDISHATEQHAGIIEIADQTEVITGIIDSKAVTPKKMKDTLSDVAYSGEFDELLGKPTSLSDFNDDLGTSPVHTHNQYQEVISDLNEIRSNASNAKTTVDTHVANNTIHVTASDKVAWSQKQNKLTAGVGIDITDNVISNTQTSAEWGNIQGNISNQEDLYTIFYDIYQNFKDFIIYPLRGDLTPILNEDGVLKFSNPPRLNIDGTITFVKNPTLDINGILKF